MTQEFAVLRVQQSRMFTLGWSLLRRCALRLGEELAHKGAIDAAYDVFFLTRYEVGSECQSASSDDLRQIVQSRRAEWERQRRLIPPPEIGMAPGPIRKILAEAFVST